MRTVPKSVCGRGLGEKLAGSGFTQGMDHLRLDDRYNLSSGREAKLFGQRRDPHLQLTLRHPKRDQYLVADGV